MIELVWDGKYRDGKRVAPVRMALPFRTVEVVKGGAGCPAQRADPARGAPPPEWVNRLIWGDKKYVLPSLLPELAGKVDLIYIDPPFDTGADFSLTTAIPESDEDLVKQRTTIEQKAYRDTWGAGLPSYLQWFCDTAVLLKEFLSAAGSIYVHVDENVGHYVKVVMDEVFGKDCFQREIIWRIGWVSGYKSKAKNWIRNHDTILFYVKSRSQLAFNKEYIPYPEGYVRRDGNPPTGEGYPIEDVWNASDVDRMDSIQIMSFSGEKLGYPTQKNDNLVSRIVRASSNRGDLVLDCFGGSGTTAAVAERLGRRWVTCDVGRFAIQTMRRRLLAIPGVAPFVVQDLGKHERQAWKEAELPGPQGSAAAETAYRRFILDRYGADSVPGSAWVHGAKGGRFVHVGAVDAPITRADVNAIAREARRMMAGGESPAPAADVLGWEIAPEVVEMAEQMAAEARVDIRFKYIPRDVLDERAVEQGDIEERDFFGLRAFSTKVAVKGRVATVTLVDFVLPEADVPEPARGVVKHGSQWLDSWAIDWRHEADIFHNQWRSYRTRAKPKLELSAHHEYERPGTYVIAVKVSDLFGHDTTKRIAIDVR